MRDYRVLLIGALGIGLLLMPSGWLAGLLPANATCLNCSRTFHVGSGRILCGRCNHIMDAAHARDLHNAVPGLPRLAMPSTKLVGPIPSDVTVIH